MAEIWAVGLATLAVGAYTADQATDAGEDAADGQERAANGATAEERRQYDLTRADQQPFMDAGTDALTRQKAFLDGDMSGFENSAGYKFQVQEGFKGLNRLASAGGSYRSGGADADRIALGQGLADANADNYWNKLAGRAGQGQATAQNLGGLGANMAGAIGNNLMNGANARASAYANTANQWGKFGEQASSQFGSWYGGLGRDNQGAYLGNNRGAG